MQYINKIMFDTERKEKRKKDIRYKFFKDSNIRKAVKG